MASSSLRGTLPWLKCGKTATGHGEVSPQLTNLGLVHGDFYEAEDHVVVHERGLGRGSHLGRDCSHPLDHVSDFCLAPRRGRLHALQQGP